MPVKTEITSTMEKYHSSCSSSHAVRIFLSSNSWSIFLKKSTSGAAQYFTIPESYGLSNCSHKNRISRGLTGLSFISLIVIHPPVINNYIKNVQHLNWFYAVKCYTLFLLYRIIFVFQREISKTFKTPKMKF